MAGSVQPYNPLDRVELGRSVERALLAQPLEELRSFLASAHRAKFGGAGLYALYYTGQLACYAAISPPQQTKGEAPIYVGRARPPGARQGATGLDSNTDKPVLFDRLRNHANSVAAVERHGGETGEPSLSVSDFLCRHLVADDIWVPLGEALLIGHYRPVWNVVVDGFGNNAVGAGRRDQQRSPWDILHPGRRYAFALQASRNPDEIRAALAEHFAGVTSPDLSAPLVVDEEVRRAIAQEPDS